MELGTPTLFPEGRGILCFFMGQAARFNLSEKVPSSDKWPSAIKRFSCFPLTGVATGRDEDWRTEMHMDVRCTPRHHPFPTYFRVALELVPLDSFSFRNQRNKDNSEHNSPGSPGEL